MLGYKASKAVKAQVKATRAQKRKALAVEGGQCELTKKRKKKKSRSDGHAR